MLVYLLRALIECMHIHSNRSPESFLNFDFELVVVAVERMKCHR